MKNRNFAAQRRARRSGTVMYFAAGSIVMMLGCAALAVDYGVLVNDKNYLQRVCDAAALGGATKLPDTTSARQLAGVVVAQNRYAADANNDITYTFLDNNRKIQVTAVRRRSLFFARVLGQNVGVVRASATAGILGSTPDIVPIGITTTSYNTQDPSLGGGKRLYDTQPSPTFTTKLINRQKESFDPDEFILFDMRPSQAKSPAHMQAQLAGQEVLDITVDQILATLEDPDPDPLDATALNADIKAQAAFFAAGMITRFQAAAGSPWLDIDPTQGTNYFNYVGQHFTQNYNGTEPTGSGNPFYRNPRVMSFIVTSPAPQTPVNYDAPIVDLATVYVTRIYISNASLLMDYRYLPTNSGSSGSGRLLE